MIFRCAGISWFQVVRESVRDVFQLAHLRVQPWFLFNYRSKGEVGCSGTLITKRFNFTKKEIFFVFFPASHVLTAAHCLYSNCTHRDPPTSVIVGQVGDILSLFFPFDRSRRARLVTLSLVDWVSVRRFDFGVFGTRTCPLWQLGQNQPTTGKA